MSLLRRLRQRLGVGLALLACLAMVTVPASAGPQDRLEKIERERQRLERTEAFFERREGKQTSALAELDRQLYAATSKLQGIRGKLSQLNARISVVGLRLERAQKKLAMQTDRLMEVQADLVDSTNAFIGRAVAAYKAGPSAMLDGLLSAGSFSELVDRIEYYESALDSDSEIVRDIQALRDETERTRQHIEAEKQSIAKDKLRLEADRAEVGALEDQQEFVVAEKRQVVGAKRQVLARIGRHQASVRDAQQQLARDEARIKAALAGGSSSSGAVPVGGGQLLWPAAGPLTSGYGPRTHPIFGDTRMHTGIDIGAPYGAPVIAADSGVVAFAGVLGGYGNAIAIDHGGGLGTSYNHLSAFYVGPGQRVRRGQQIGAVGCTGYCTGPHLHFEVRINGSPVDPMPYLQ